jgi:hypothetical protein
MPAQWRVYSSTGGPARRPAGYVVGDRRLRHSRCDPDPSSAGLLLDRAEGDKKRGVLTTENRAGGPTPSGKAHDALLAEVERNRELARNGGPVDDRGPVPGGGSLSTLGEFNDVRDRRARGKGPHGADAYTGSNDIKWDASVITAHENPDGSYHVDLDLAATLGKLQTTYYGEAHRGSPNELDGTLGAHEDGHKASMRDFWKTSNLEALLKDEGVSLSFDVPAGSQKGAVAKGVEQAKAIVRFLSAHSDYHEDQNMDRGANGIPRPVFRGVHE